MDVMEKVTHKYDHLYLHYILTWCHEINSHKINCHQINSHEINLPQDQLSRDQFAMRSTQFFKFEKTNEHETHALNLKVLFDIFMACR